jgi:UDP:flavonoid glycosyltransferase YjiC (YdhE family)
MFSGGAREISIAVRDGLLLLEQQQATQPETLIDELEQEAAASLRAVQNLIDGMARQRRLYIANGMREAIAAGVEVGGTFSLARWREIQETFDAFEQWLATPLAGCKVPPIVVVSRRGNPPELVQPPEPTEPTPEVPAPLGPTDPTPEPPTEEPAP